MKLILLTILLSILLNTIITSNKNYKFKCEYKYYLNIYNSDDTLFLSFNSHISKIEYEINDKDIVFTVNELKYSFVINNVEVLDLACINELMLNEQIEIKYDLKKLKKNMHKDMLLVYQDTDAVLTTGDIILYTSDGHAKTRFFGNSKFDHVGLYDFQQYYVSSKLSGVKRSKIYLKDLKNKVYARILLVKKKMVFEETFKEFVVINLGKKYELSYSEIMSNALHNNPLKKRGDVYSRDTYYCSQLVYYFLLNTDEYGYDKLYEKNIYPKDFELNQKEFNDILDNKYIRIIE